MISNKKLGQHFLTNKLAIKKIVDALDLQKNDTIIEIGPGRGALTLPLAKQCQASSIKCQVIGIEKDRALATSYKQQETSIFEVLEGDVLKILPKLVAGRLSHVSWKLVGNIPYYITGKLLRILGELKEKPSLIVLTIQKEVAERIAVKPPRMNLLAAATQIWADPQVVAILPKNYFSPAPKVDSAIIKLTPKEAAGDLKKYYFTLKTAFKQPRKTVLNNLSTGLKISKNEALEMMKKAGLEGSERPQNLNVETLLKLSTLFKLK